MKKLVTLETLHTYGRVNSCVKNGNIIDNIKTLRIYMSILKSFVIDKIITNNLCVIARRLIYRFFMCLFVLIRIYPLGRKSKVVFSLTLAILRFPAKKV